MLVRVRVRVGVLVEATVELRWGSYLVNLVKRVRKAIKAGLAVEAAHTKREKVDEAGVLSD